MRAFATAVVTIVLVVITSMVSVTLWAEKAETVAEKAPITMTAEMTVAQLGEANALSKKLLARVFGLNAPEQLQQPITGFGLSLEQVRSKLDQELTLQAEDASKNWLKIPLKFTLWFLFMALCFTLLYRAKLTKKARLILYGLGFVLFGVILGADPSPMGTVKDAIVLYAAKGVIFKPRLVAFSIFTLTVVLANKFICSWGCQLGALQDFIFRLNRNDQDSERGALPQYKIPFVISNSVRLLFFAALIWVAVAWAYDLTHEIDPFKIFKPAVISATGWIFIVALLLLSLFVYRPWCHLFCPFGLSGWLFEKLSLFRIKVDYDTCISCGACEKACPSPVMAAILHRDKTVIPDCFSCGNCIETCPTRAVSFAFGKREKPPADR